MIGIAGTTAIRNDSGRVKSEGGMATYCFEVFPLI